MSARWGLAGLLAFEAIVVWFALQGGSLDFAILAAIAAAALGWGIFAHKRDGSIPNAVFAILAIVTLLRALNQTLLPGRWAAGILPTYLVPLGFGLLLWWRAKPALAISLVAIARTWFVLWYFLQGPPLLAFANLLGAVGAWLWWSSEALVEPAPPADAASQH